MDRCKALFPRNRAPQWNSTIKLYHAYVRFHGIYDLMLYVKEMKREGQRKGKICRGVIFSCAGSSGYTAVPVR